jgi:hypothetical protein
LEAAGEAPLMSRTRSVEAYFDDDCFEWFDRRILAQG